MIYEKDLDESIAKYQGEINPSIETCQKLASCLIVKRELFGRNPEQLPVGQSYSFAAEPSTIDYHSGTEFSQAIQGREWSDILPVLDELMTAVQVGLPRLYVSTIRRLNDPKLP